MRNRQRQETDFTYIDEDIEDIFADQEMGNHVIDFDIVKSGRIGITYKIVSDDSSVEITAGISRFNRCLSWIFIILLYFSFILLFTWLFPAIIILLFFLNYFIGIRRLTVQTWYNGDETFSCRIKGNIFFTKWKISDNPEWSNLFFSFPLFRSKGELNTTSGVCQIKGLKNFLWAMGFGNGDIEIVDSNDEHIFSLYPQDSIYARKRFRIGSDGQLDPIQICLASICMIERFYRPKSRSND